MQVINSPTSQGLIRKRRISKEENMDGKENANTRVLVHSENDSPSKYLEDYQRSSVAEVLRRKERHLEQLLNQEAAAKRGKIAAQVLRVRQARDIEESEKKARTKQEVWENERGRAYFVASLPPPAKDPVDEILEKFQPIELYTTKHMGTTKYISEVKLVERALPALNEYNAKDEAVRVLELEEKDQIKRMKKSENDTEKANQRFNSALQKEQLKNGCGEIMVELHKVEMATRVKQQKKIFRPLENCQPTRSFPTCISGEIMTPEREYELEKAVEKILNEDEIPIHSGDLNVTIRRKARNNSRLGIRQQSPIPFDEMLNSSIRSLDELATPGNDASLKKVLSELRSEREATMKKARSSPLSLPEKDTAASSERESKDRLFGIKFEPEKSSVNNDENRTDIFNNGFEGTAFLNPPETSQPLVSVSTQTVEPYKADSSSSSSSLSSSSLLSELAKLSPLTSNFDKSLNKNTQTDLVERYQQLLLLRAQESLQSSSNSSKSNDSSSVTFRKAILVEGPHKETPMLKDYLEKVVQRHFEKEGVKDLTTPKKRFFRPLPCEKVTDDLEWKPDKHKLDLGVNTVSNDGNSPSTGVPPKKSSSLDKISRDVKSSLAPCKDKPAPNIKSKKPFKADNNNKSFMLPPSIDKPVNTKTTKEQLDKSPLLRNQEDERPEGIEGIGHATKSMKERIKTVDDPAEPTPKEKVNTSALLVSSTKSASSTASPNDSDIPSQNASSTSTSSAESVEARIPNYIQFKVLNENRLQGFPHGAIESIDELRELLARLVPSGEELDSWIRPKPPISYPQWINDSLIPHELSTIIEVDTPHTSMIAADNKEGKNKEMVIPEINLQLFPNGKTADKRAKDDSSVTLSSLGKSKISQASTPMSSAATSESSIFKSPRWADVLKNPTVIPLATSTISTISSLSSGLLDAFNPTRIASQSTPVKTKDIIPSADVTEDNLEMFNLTLVGHEISISEDDKQNPLLTTPMIPIKSHSYLQRKETQSPSKNLSTPSASSFQTLTPVTSRSYLHKREIQSPAKNVTTPLTPSFQTLTPITAYGTLSPLTYSLGRSTSMKSFITLSPHTSLETWKNQSALRSPMRSSLSHRDSILSDSMASFLNHEQSAMFGDHLEG